MLKTVEKPGWPTVSLLYTQLKLGANNIWNAAEAAWIEKVSPNDIVLG